jgi:hypothetical protein
VAAARAGDALGLARIAVDQTASHYILVREASLANP